MLQSPEIVTIIQARNGSTRLPGKILMDIEGKSLLSRMYERVKRSTLAGTIVVATTTEKEDDSVEQLCIQEKMNCFRGHPTDLLDRHYQAGRHFSAQAIVKIPSDCPLIDPAIIDKVIRFFLSEKNQYDYVSNLHPASFPDGNDVEIMTMAALENAWKNARKPMEREHTTPYFWENPALFKIGNVVWETGKDYSQKHRWTIDYPEDYELIRQVYKELYHLNPIFTMEDIIDLLEKRPDIYQLNHQYAGEYWYKNHINELKTVNYKGKK